ncbi:hypothetical protein ACOSQ3_019437 [Xanthoceras sorbifolium]
MSTKKGKDRGGWAKTQSISRIYGKNSSSSLAPTPTTVPVKAPTTTITPANSSTISTATILASSTEHALAPEPTARRPTAPAISTTRTTTATHPTAPSISRAPTTTPVTEVTPPTPRAHAPTPTPAYSHSLRSSFGQRNHVVDSNTEQIESLETRDSPLIEEHIAGSK